MGSNRRGIAEGEGVVRPLDLNQARPQADLPLKKSNRSSAFSLRGPVSLLPIGVSLACAGPRSTQKEDLSP